MGLTVEEPGGSAKPYCPIPPQAGFSLSGTLLASTRARRGTLTLRRVLLPTGIADGSRRRCAIAVFPSLADDDQLAVERLDDEAHDRTSYLHLRTRK